MRTIEISNNDDVIDSRDVVARIEQLEAQENREDDENTELANLQALAKECEGIPDFGEGAALIRDSHFEDYAQETAIECGLIEDAEKWPKNCIDWEAAARELKYDYSCVSFDGVDYWIQN